MLKDRKTEIKPNLCSEVKIWNSKLPKSNFGGILEKESGVFMREGVFKNKYGSNVLFDVIYSLQDYLLDSK